MTAIVKDTGFCPLHNGTKHHCARGTLVQRFRNLILLTLGLVFVALGMIGIIVPMMPTTPFLLLALALFSRSSPLLYAWVYRSRLFGPILQEWQQHRAIRPHVRYTALAAVLLGVGFTCVGSDIHAAAKGLACIGGAIGLAVVFRLPVRRDHQRCRQDGRAN